LRPFWSSGDSEDVVNVGGGALKKVDPTTGRIHPGFLLHSTVTGRLVVREPNAQNVDKDPLIRNCFQAPEGRLLMEADLDQAELRVLANFSGDPALAAIYREGRSLHKEVALALYGEGYTEDEYRQAKSLNFGSAYGLQAEGLVKKFGGPTVSQGEPDHPPPSAGALIDKWAATFPAAWDYLQRQKAAVEVGKATEVRSPTGRLRRFRHVTERTLADAGNESCNFGIQATASDVCLSAAIALRPFVNERGGKIIALIHDSVLMELPDDPEPVREIASETARQFAEFGTRFASGEVRITSSFKVGRQWGALEKYDAHLS
jgi:DNA polymerase-1